MWSAFSHPLSRTRSEACYLLFLLARAAKPAKGSLDAKLNSLSTQVAQRVCHWRTLWWIAPRLPPSSLSTPDIILSSTHRLCLHPRSLTPTHPRPSIHRYTTPIAYRRGWAPLLSAWKLDVRSRALTRYAHGKGRFVSLPQHELNFNFFLNSSYPTDSVVSTFKFHVQRS